MSNKTITCSAVHSDHQELGLLYCTLSVSNKTIFYDTVRNQFLRRLFHTTLVTVSRKTIPCYIVHCQCPTRPFSATQPVSNKTVPYYTVHSVQQDHSIQQCTQHSQCPPIPFLTIMYSVHQNHSLLQCTVSTMTIPYYKLVSTMTIPYYNIRCPPRPFLTTMYNVHQDRCLLQCTVSTKTIPYYNVQCPPRPFLSTVYSVHQDPQLLSLHIVPIISKACRSQRPSWCGWDTLVHKVR